MDKYHGDNGEKNFNSLFRESLVEGLRVVLGDSGSRAILYHTKLGEGEISPGTVHDKLVALFGERSSMLIEQKILFELGKRTNQDLSAYGPNFVVTCGAARKSYEERI